MMTGGDIDNGRNWHFQLTKTDHLTFWCAEKKGINLLNVDGKKVGYKGIYREEVKREQKRVPEKRNEYKGKGELNGRRFRMAC
jgi:hypothetical protein